MMIVGIILILIALLLPVPFWLLYVGVVLLILGVLWWFIPSGVEGSPHRRRIY